MPRRTTNEHGENHERWLVSYADFITLLFAFFVVMYAISAVDSKRMKQVMHSIRWALHAEGVGGIGTIPVIKADFAQGLVELPPVVDELFRREQMELQNLGQTIQEALQRSVGAPTWLEMVRFSIDERGLVMSLSAKYFFDPGKAALYPEVLPIIDEIARVLKPLDREIRIEGHTDNVPIQTALYPSNWELSTARATYIIKYLISTFGFPPNRLSAAGYGEYRPVASNSTHDGRGRNRRVDIVVLSRTITSHLLSGPMSPAAMQQGNEAGKE
ncbi:MAG: OmpA family protein [Nitrospinae bacterium]|nr:OmpA family protein [Nitrospinota bacterium]